VEGKEIQASCSKEQRHDGCYELDKSDCSLSVAGDASMRKKWAPSEQRHRPSSQEASLHMLSLASK
jgi:hypothetical protein